VTPEELPDFLRAIRDRAADAAPETVMAMADTYQRHLTGVTLDRYSHPPFTKTPAPVGQPPARISGELAASVRSVLGPSSGSRAHATTAPHTVYARIQEIGGVIRAKRSKYLKWLTDYPTSATAFWKSAREGEGLFMNFARSVVIPPRPYMRPATEECVANGSLTRAAMAAFMAKVWG
jgi:hypothetical protein